MATITHAFVNPKSDGSDTTITRPSDWNADHVITLGAARYLDNSSHANYTTTSTSFVALDAASDLTITTGAHRVLCGATLTAGNNGANSTGFDIDIDGTRQGHATLGLIITNDAATGLAFTYLSAPLTASSHTFKLFWKVSAGTGTVFVNTTGVALHFWVAEMMF